MSIYSYSYNESNDTVEVVDKHSGQQKKSYSPSKATALAFGYMGIGLLITGLVAFLTCFFLNLALANGADTDTVLLTYLGLIMGGAIGLLIDGVVVNIIAMRGKNILVPAIIYCVFMGLMCSGLLIVDGVDWYTIGEAFLITAVIFGAMFAIGYFSKVNFSPVLYVGMLLLLCLFGLALFAGIMYLVSGGTAFGETYFWTNFLIYVIVCVLLIVCVAVDAYNIRKILTKGTAGGQGGHNLILYCAYIMYVDFIVILLRVILILASSKNNN